MRYNLMDLQCIPISTCSLEGTSGTDAQGRPAVNGTSGVLHTGAFLRDLPERCRLYTTAYNHFNRVNRATGPDG